MCTYYTSFVVIYTREVRAILCPYMTNYIIYKALNYEIERAIEKFIFYIIFIILYSEANHMAMYMYRIVVYGNKGDEM